VGNVVSPSSGTLTTIVSQDPMYVSFPVAFREALELRQKYATRGGFNAVLIRIRLPDGRLYSREGKLDFINNTIAANTDTITLRGEIANPLLFDQNQTRSTARELYDGEFVAVQLEGVQPVEVLAVPRSAVLSDQQGDYVYVVGPDNKAEQRRIQLGQSTSTIAAVISGLTEGEHVIVEGLQRVRPGQEVSPGPASPPVQATQAAAQGGNQNQPSGVGPNQGAAAASGAPPRPDVTGASGPRSGTTANAPASVAPPAGQASSGTAGGALPAPAGNPSSRH
jgi:membrane fusion protein (multidrug efflux system)